MCWLTGKDSPTWLTDNNGPSPGMKVKLSIADQDGTVRVGVIDVVSQS